MLSITDFKSHKVFDGFSTYTAISIFDKNNTKECFNYKELNNGKIKTINKIDFKNLNSTKWNLTSYENEVFLKKLFENKKVTL